MSERKGRPVERCECRIIEVVAPATRADEVEHPGETDARNWRCKWFRFGDAGTAVSFYGPCFDRWVGAIERQVGREPSSAYVVRPSDGKVFEVRYECAPEPSGVMFYSKK